MTIKDYLKPITNASDDARLSDFQNKINNIENQLYGAFSTFKTLVDAERINYPKDIEIKVNETLKTINRDYRKYILNVSEDYKREGISVWSFCGKTLTAEIGNEFNFNFNVKSYKDRSRLCYTKEKLSRAMIIALSFLFAKYSVVYDFQIKYTFIKVLIDFFDFKTISYLEAFNVYTQIINLDLGIIANTIKDLEIQTKVKVVKRERKSKTELPTKEQFEYWLTNEKHSITEIKEIIAKQYQVSAKTVQRKLAEYGLTRKYNSK